MSDIIKFEKPKRSKIEVFSFLKDLQSRIDLFYSHEESELEIEDKVKLGYFHQFIGDCLKETNSVKFINLFLDQIGMFTKPDFENKYEVLDYWDDILTYTTLTVHLKEEFLNQPIEKSLFIMNVLNQAELSPTQFAQPARILLFDDIYASVLPQKKYDPHTKAIRVAETIASVRPELGYQTALQLLDDWDKPEKPLSTLQEVYEYVIDISNLLHKNELVDSFDSIFLLEKYPQKQIYYDMIEKIRNEYIESGFEKQPVLILQLTQFLLEHKDLWLLDKESLERTFFGEQNNNAPIKR